MPSNQLFHFPWDFMCDLTLLLACVFILTYPEQGPDRKVIPCSAKISMYLTSLLKEI